MDQHLEGANDTVAALSRLFVLSAARGHSLGLKLVEAATGYAQDQGLRLVLDVVTEDATAIRLYERLGWRRIGVTEHDNGKGHRLPAVYYMSPIVEK